ncbi:MAG: type II secretion system GspH family protein [Synergistaceae bacterium]|nr:type II secretion system GspH family protein [Synergistaceae bacterium]
MKKRIYPGFTLIEIMLAVALVGIIAATALAPLVFTVESLKDTQKQWGARIKERAAVENIFADVRGAVENPSFAPLRTIHNGGLTVQEDDRLLIWSASPVREGGIVSLVVYRVLTGSALDNKKGGLYRWILEGVKSDPNLSGELFSKGLIAASRSLITSSEDPIKFDSDKLKAEDGRMVLPDAEGMRISVWSGTDWVQDYEGSVPEALKIGITIKGKKHVYEEWFPAIRH